MSDGLTVRSWSSVSWRCFGLLVPTGPRSEAWECGLAYSKEEEGVGAGRHCSRRAGYPLVSCCLVVEVTPPNYVAVCTFSIVVTVGVS